MRSAIAAACTLGLAGWLESAAPQPAHDEHAGHAAPAPADAHARHAVEAPPRATTPAVSDAERAAAFPDLGSTSVHDTMVENPLNRLVMFERLETQDAEGSDVLHWDLDTWIGRDITKLWIRSEGDRRSGDTERADVELLWGKAFARWWELAAGARVDFAPGPDQEWAAVGVRGVAPYEVGLEATAYVGRGGQTALRVDARYELLVTNRLVLEPSLELDWYGESDPERGHGSGLADGELGVRLRYEVRREIAPYVGLIYERSFGGTAELARAAGRETADTRLVAGIRAWF
jgi:copper resistance protein B